MDGLLMLAIASIVSIPIAIWIEKLAVRWGRRVRGEI